MKIRKRLVLIAVLLVTGLRKGQAIPPDGQSMPAVSHQKHLTVLVTQFDRRIVNATSRPPVPDAEVRLALLMKPVVGSPYTAFLNLKTNSLGVCPLQFDADRYDEIDWMCEVEKHLPDGRVLREVSLPAYGELTGIQKDIDKIEGYTLTVSVDDVNDPLWPFPDIPRGMPSPPSIDDLDFNFPPPSPPL